MDKYWGLHKYITENNVQFIETSPHIAEGTFIVERADFGGIRIYMTPKSYSDYCGWSSVKTGFDRELEEIINE